jgi:hypothetical protein
MKTDQALLKNRARIAQELLKNELPNPKLHVPNLQNENVQAWT